MEKMCGWGVVRAGKRNGVMMSESGPEKKDIYLTEKLGQMENMGSQIEVYRTNTVVASDNMDQQDSHVNCYGQKAAKSKGEFSSVALEAVKSGS